MSDDVLEVDDLPAVMKQVGDVSRVNVKLPAAVQTVRIGGFVMKKKYKLDEIDCANCALKLENAIKEVDGVSGVKVNYVMQKMTLEADDAAFDKVEKEVLKLCKKLEPDMDVEVM